MERPKNIKRILVTGVSGQLGRSIQKIASEYPNLDFVFTNSQDLDITDSEKVNSFFEKCNFDYCINCAAFTTVEQAEKTPKPAFAVNAKGVKNIATSCKGNNVVLIHVSTDYVFDGEKGEAYAIDDEPNSINECGKSKLQGEKKFRKSLINIT